MKTYSVRWKLLVTVNLTLGILLAVLLVWEYRREMAEAAADKHAALTDEAIAVHQAVTHLLRGHGVEEVQQYVDTVCSAMRHGRSPGHHIVVEFEGKTVQAHHAESQELVEALRVATLPPDHQVTFQGKQLIVASQSSEGVTVYLSEYLTNIRRAIRAEVLWQSGILAGLALLAAVIVNVTLVKLVTRPLQLLASVVTGIARGQFGEQVSPFGNSELDDMAQAVNSMSRTLAESEQRRRRQMMRAREIQEHLLPQQLQIPGMKAAALYRPAEEVAGDYYDVYRLPDGTWLICVADVVGHGVPAAMGAAMLKMLVANAVEYHRDPGDVLDDINRRFVAASLPGYFASVFLARWHPSTLRMDYANAGHEPALLLNDDGCITPLAATGTFIGIEDGSCWKTQTRHLCAEDRLLIMTDGVVEATDAEHNLFGRQRATEWFGGCRATTLEESLSEIEQAITMHQGPTAALDDVTLLLIEIAPQNSPYAVISETNAAFIGYQLIRRIS